MRNQVSVDYVLFKLNEVFKVVDISSELIVADNIENAEEICLRRNLDRVPIKKEGKIVSYFELKTRSESVINQDSIMADSKGILDAFIYLSKRDFYFIESEKRIDTYSALFRS